MKPDKMSFFERSKKKEEELREELGEGERGDFAAMLISAFLVIFPICVVAILLISFLVLWLFGAL